MECYILFWQAAPSQVIKFTCITGFSHNAPAWTIILLSVSVFTLLCEASIATVCCLLPLNGWNISRRLVISEPALVFWCDFTKTNKATSSHHTVVFACNARKGHGIIFFFPDAAECFSVKTEVGGWKLKIWTLSSFFGAVELPLHVMRTCPRFRTSELLWAWADHVAWWLPYNSNYAFELAWGPISNSHVWKAKFIIQ